MTNDPAIPAMKIESCGPRQFSVIEAAEYLRLHPRTVYALIEEGLIRHRRKGPRKGRIFFLERDLEDYITGKPTGKVPP